MILQQLREATRDEHQQLEARIDLLERAWSIDFYRALLEKLFGFYQPLEPAIFAHPQWQHFHFAVEPRRKLDWLRQDLRFLGLNDRQIETLAHCPFTPCTATFAQAVGCAYVIEGSTLGGQIIARHLKNQLGVSEAEGCRFFTAYGMQTGSMWREFIALLNAQETLPDEQNVVVESARTTFRTLECWINEIL